MTALTLTGPETVAEGAEARYTVALEGTAFANPTAITWTVTHGDTVDADLAAEAGGEAETHALLLPEVTRAVVSEMFGAIAERAGGVGGQLDGGGGFSFNGQSNWSDIAANQARALAAGAGALSCHPRSSLHRHPRSLLSGGDIDSKELLRGLHSPCRFPPTHRMASMATAQDGRELSVRADAFVANSEVEVDGATADNTVAIEGRLKF